MRWLMRRPTAIGRFSISYRWRFIWLKKFVLCFVGKLTYHKCSFTFPLLIIQIRTQKRAFFFSFVSQTSQLSDIIHSQTIVMNFVLSVIVIQKLRFTWPWSKWCCEDEIFLVVTKYNLQESGNDGRMMATTNLSESRTHTQTFDESLCSSVWAGEFKQQSISFSAVNILLSITATLGNSLILVALHKESSLHPPSKLFYRCLATTDLLVGLVTQPIYATYWMSVVHEHWSLCRYARDANIIPGYALFGVSLLTATAISVDRLLAMLLGLRYKEIVTLRRTYIILAIVWVVCLVTGLFSYLDHRIGFWCSFIIIPSCLIISIASYIKIFRALRHHEVQVQDHVQQQPSQTTALNMARYRKAVYSALWVQLALVVCYVPHFTGIIAIFLSAERFSNFNLIYGMTNVLAFFNSTINPFLYCWRISEVRRAVKQTIRQAICHT